MKRLKMRLLGAVLCAALSIAALASTAYAALDITSAIKFFGIVYVVDLFQTQLNHSVNAVTLNGGAAIKDTTKVVPIISVGTGAYVGAAQVTGPAMQVAKVQAVAQIEGEFFNDAVRAKVLIPLENRSPQQGLRRVDQVGVSAVLDITIESSAPAPPSSSPPTPPTPPVLVPKPPILAPSQPSYPSPAPPAPGNNENETLRRWPALGYALFATDDIELRGNNIRILGSIRANDDINIKGNSVSVSSDVMANGNFVDDGNKGPFGWNTNWKKPNYTHVGDIYTPTMNWSEMQRKAGKSYRGKTTMNGNTVLRGVTTVDGDLTLDGWVQGGGVVVVHGNVVITRKGAGAPDGLLIWADGDVRISESNTDVHASIITSRDISISGSNARVVGTLTGRDITISGNNVDIITNTEALAHFPL